MNMYYIIYITFHENKKKKMLILVGLKKNAIITYTEQHINSRRPSARKPVEALSLVTLKS